jgi:autotransporter-associated beta strand protein
MQTTSTSRALKKTATLLLPLITLASSPVSAALYWDPNGTTDGAGATPTGTWNAANTNWNTDSAGILAPGVWVASETAVFSAGVDAIDTFTVTLGAAQTASAVIVEEGTVTLAGSALNIGGGSITINSGAKLAIPATANITATAGATMNLNGGTIRNTVNASGGPSFISANFTINVGAAGGAVETATTGTFTTIFTGNIKGVGNTLTKTGIGEFRYQGANTSGATFAKLVVNQGLFRLGNVAGNNFETGFGAVPAVFTPDAITLDTGAIGTSWLAADSVLHANRGITLAAGGGTIMSALTVPGAVTGPGGLTATAGGVNLNGLNTFTGGITVTTGTTTIGVSGGMLAQPVNNAGTLLINGILSGGNSLIKAGTGTLTLNGDNTFTGSTIINAGILNVGHANALGTPSANTQIVSGAELRIDGSTKTFTLNEPLQIAGPGAGGGGAITIQNLSSPTISSAVTLTADATVTVSSTATGTFTNADAFTGATSTLTLQGGAGAGGGGTISGSIDLGTGGLTKLQGGRWTLSAANFYTGPTTISAGTLLINGSITDTSVVDVSGTLGGNGTITPASGGNVNLLAGGKLSPGTSVGNLTLSLSGGGIVNLAGATDAANSQALLFELDTVAASDRITLTSGVLGIGLNTLEFDDFAFTLLGGFDVGDYILFDGIAPISGSFGPVVSGTLGGLDANLQLADNGNDLVLRVVPEPGSVALLIGGVALLVGRRRRQG